MSSLVYKNELLLFKTKEAWLVDIMLTQKIKISGCH
jgi:hypothetical protein